MKEIEKERQDKDGSPDDTPFRTKQLFIKFVLFALSVYILFELGKRVGEAAFHLSN